MELRVIWSKSAEFSLDGIFDYYSEKVNVKLAKKIIHSIIDKTKSLKNNPFIGQLEPLLNERTELFQIYSR